MAALFARSISAIAAKNGSNASRSIPDILRIETPQQRGNALGLGRSDEETDVSNDTCSIEDCEKRVLSRGWCTMHYQRWRTHGDPETTLMPTRVNGTTEERFLAKVLPADSQGCRLWDGATYPSGYGCFLYNKSNTGAHRASYEMYVGPIPEGLEIDHTCHTNDLSCPGGVTCKHRRCVTPEHLEPVTGKVNCLRGRSPAALHAVKTHCAKGHPFSEENTYRGTGRRYCRKCGNEAGRKYRAKKSKNR